MANNATAVYQSQPVPPAQTTSTSNTEFYDQINAEPYDQSGQPQASPQQFEATARAYSQKPHSRLYFIGSYWRHKISHVNLAICYLTAPPSTVNTERV